VYAYVEMAHGRVTEILGKMAVPMDGNDGSVVARPEAQLLRPSE
jgi:hypothetical protein